MGWGFTEGGGGVSLRVGKVSRAVWVIIGNYEFTNFLLDEWEWLCGVAMWGEWL